MMGTRPSVLKRVAPDSESDEESSAKRSRVESPSAKLKHKEDGKIIKSKHAGWSFLAFGEKPKVALGWRMMAKPTQVTTLALAAAGSETSLSGLDVEMAPVTGSTQPTELSPTQLFVINPDLVYIVASLFRMDEQNRTLANMRSVCRTWEHCASVVQQAKLQYAIVGREDGGWRGRNGSAEKGVNGTFAVLESMSWRQKRLIRELYHLKPRTFAPGFFRHIESCANLVHLDLTDYSPGRLRLSQGMHMTYEHPAAIRLAHLETLVLTFRIHGDPYAELLEAKCCPALKRIKLALACGWSWAKVPHCQEAMRKYRSLRQLKEIEMEVFATDVEDIQRRIYQPGNVNFVVTTELICRCWRSQSRSWRDVRVKLANPYHISTDRKGPQSVRSCRFKEDFFTKQIEWVNAVANQGHITFCAIKLETATAEDRERCSLLQMVETFLPSERECESWLRAAIGLDSWKRKEISRRWQPYVKFGTPIGIRPELRRVDLFDDGRTPDSIDLCELPGDKADMKVWEWQGHFDVDRYWARDQMPRRASEQDLERYEEAVRIPMIAL